MKNTVGYPRENVRIHTPVCPECGAEPENGFEVSEIAERWLVAHVSMLHPEEADFISAMLVRHGMKARIGKAPAKTSAPRAEPEVQTPRRMVRRKPARKRPMGTPTVEPVAGADPYLEGAP